MKSPAWAPGNRKVVFEGLHCFGRGSRALCITNGAADNNVVAAVLESGLDRDDALLITDRLVVDGTNPRRHHQQFVVDVLTQGGLEPFRCHAVQPLFGPAGYMHYRLPRPEIADRHVLPRDPHGKTGA